MRPCDAAPPAIVRSDGPDPPVRASRPAGLRWDVQRNLDAQALPEAQTVAELTFRGIARELREWWLLVGG